MLNGGVKPFGNIVRRSRRSASFPPGRESPCSRRRPCALHKNPLMMVRGSRTETGAAAPDYHVVVGTAPRRDRPRRKKCHSG